MNSHFHAGCSSGSINSYKQVLKRQGRKFPYVPRKKKFHVFWPTYRGAVSWMRQHQKIIDTAIGLLEIYPNIISDYSMDVFWDFIYPYLYPKPTLSKPHNGKLSGKTMRETKQTAVVLPKLKPSIPLISVTQDSDPEEESEILLDEFQENHRISKVCVVGELEKSDETDHTSNVVNDLSSFSFVYRNSAMISSCDALYESDFIIYLLSNQTLNNNDCCDKLMTAWSLDIPTVFVRSKNFKLSSPLPETFLQYSMKSENLLKVSRNEGRSLTPSVERNTLRQKRENFKRSDSATSALYGSLFETQKQSTKPSDLLFYVINGYGEAIVYDEKFPSSAVQEIRSVLQQKSETTRNSSAMSRRSGGCETHTRPVSFERLSSSHRSQATSDQFLNVPTSMNSLTLDTERLPPLNISPISPDLLSRASSTKSPIHLEVPLPHEIDQDPDSGVHSPVEKETFYLVYPDPLFSPKNTGPKVVRWPPDENDFPPFSPDSSTTLDSPITFCDIDLSKELNQDLYSPDDLNNFD